MIYLFILSGLAAVLCVAAFLCFLFIRSTLSVRITCLLDHEGARLDLHLYFLNRERWSFSLSGEEWDTLLEKVSVVNGQNCRTSNGRASEVPAKRQSVLQEWRANKERLTRTIQAIGTMDSIQLHGFSWRTACGTGQAVETAMLCGLIWSLKSVALTPFRPIMIGTPHIEVVPFYQKKELTSLLSCMITIKAGQAIFIMRQLRQQMKG